MDPDWVVAVTAEPNTDDGDGGVGEEGVGLLNTEVFVAFAAALNTD